MKKAFEGKLLNEKELAEVRRAEDWEPAEVFAGENKGGKSGKIIHLVNIKKEVIFMREDEIKKGIQLMCDTLKKYQDIMWIKMP